MDTNAVSNDRGETLIETLISMVLLSIAVVAIIGAVGAQATFTLDHRGVTKTDVAVKEAAETVKAMVYSASGYTAPTISGFTITSSYGCVPTSDTTSFPKTDLQASPCTDTGLQLVTVIAVPTSGGASESVDVMKRS